VNWNDKTENLRAIARQLNIGLDSLVFVDDNPVERARVRESLPAIAVPELPADPAHYVRAIAAHGFFEATLFTEEDRSRAAQYAANTNRDAFRDASASIEEFLRGLDMSVSYGPVVSIDFARAIQLINKTNQFNTTTRRLTREELEEWVACSDAMALQFRLFDRFGDNGLVSVMLFRAGSSGDGVLELVNWVMSCRVFGRQLEHEVMNIAVEMARQRGARAFVADYLPTEKNKVIANLFAQLGFRAVAGVDHADRGASRWSLDLADYKPHATHIAPRRDSRG
jgi:FkbH-like protein